MHQGRTRTIKELIVRYELEPSLRDIFVEGRRDKITFETFFGDIGGIDVKVYEVTTVEVSNEAASRLGLDLWQNNRNMVITLAHELHAQFSDCNQVRCVADRDADLVLEITYNCPLLLFTDYSCLEMYLFNERVISKFFFVILRGFRQPANVVLTELAQTLEKLFLIRLANEVLNLKMKWLYNRKYFNFKTKKISFNEKKFIKSYLDKNGKGAMKEKFETMVEDLKKHLTANPLNQIRGEDFIRLFCDYIKKCGGKKVRAFGVPKVVEGGLFACLETEQLKEEELFRALIQWLKVN